jgi:hypothetical protein
MMAVSFTFSLLVGGLIGAIVPTTFRETTASLVAVRSSRDTHPTVQHEPPAPAVAD